MKKLILGAIGVAVLSGFIFGGNMIPYAQTAYEKAATAVESKVPVSFQIDAAKKQLERIGPEINHMNQEIAKEIVDIKKLANSIKRQQAALEKSEGDMISLRSHLDSGDKFYVAANSRAYSTDDVKRDLRQRLTSHKTGVATLEKDQKVIELRKKSLDAAIERVQQAEVQKTELSLQIEHLTAQHRMNEVVKTASKLDQLDDSQLSRTRSMVEDISARLDAEQEMMSMMPTHFGSIPVGEAADSGTDILDEIDAFFDKQDAKESKKEVDSKEFVSTTR